MTAPDDREAATAPTVETCALCGADRTTVALALSSKSSFKRYVCASPSGCRRRREQTAALAAAEARGVERGRAEAVEAIARLEAERDDLRDQLRAAVENVGILEEIRDRRTAERDEARAELSANERSEDARLAIAEAERDEARQGPAWAAYLTVRDDAELAADVSRLIAERDAAIELLDHLTDDDPCDYDHHDYCQTHHLLSRPCANARAIALIAAVAQTTPSSPLETPQTADSGEAGVVEGAGGSEAAEGDGRPELVAFVEDGLGVTLTSWQRDLLAPKPEGTDA